MGDGEIDVTFQPASKAARCAPGTRLLDAATAVGIILDLPCGGEGSCGKCRVRLLEGAGEPNEVERRALPADELQRGFRLACQTVVARAMVVDVPETSLLASYHKILARWTRGADGIPDPSVAKTYLELPPPARGDDRPDMIRLEDALGPVAADLAVLRELPGRIRQSNFRGTAVVADGRLIDFEPGDSTSQCYAAAVDVGTTTLVAMLVDLHTGEELAVASRLNPQTAFGDDVLSRIVHSCKAPGGLIELQRSVVEAIDAMIGEMSEGAGISRRHIYEVTLAGNTTMQQLLLAIDPRHLGEVPFSPATRHGVTAAAAELGLAVHPRARAHVLPVIGGFVGGDIVAGMLATALTELESPSLLVDIGTNGEIVLWAGDKLWAAATAAGPAFEGARIEHGMRAGAGAIERVALTPEVRCSTIANQRPVGLCGSGLIDVAAELLRQGMITPEGRLLWPGELGDGVPTYLVDRLVAHNGEAAFVLVQDHEARTGNPILLSQRDVRQLQLASGAIRAGIAVLLKRAGLKPDDLNNVLVAGGFGNYIRRRNAQRIGLLPEGIPKERIRYQGNASLAGARLVALSREARRRAEDLAARTKHVDLSTDPNFQWAFADGMIFPD